MDGIYTLTVEVMRFSSTLATMSSRALVSSSSFFFRACNCSFNLLFLCTWGGRGVWNIVVCWCTLIRKEERSVHLGFFVSMQAEREKLVTQVYDVMMYTYNSIMHGYLCFSLWKFSLTLSSSSFNCLFSALSCRVKQ